MVSGLAEKSAWSGSCGDGGSYADLSVECRLIGGLAITVVVSILATIVALVYDAIVVERESREQMKVYEEVASNDAATNDAYTRPKPGAYGAIEEQTKAAYTTKVQE